MQLDGFNCQQHKKLLGSGRRQQRQDENCPPNCRVQPSGVSETRPPRMSNVSCFTLAGVLSKNCQPMKTAIEERGKTVSAVIL